MNKRASNRRRIYSSQEHASIGGDSSQLESLKPIAHSDDLCEPRDYCNSIPSAKEIAALTEDSNAGPSG